MSSSSRSEQTTLLMVAGAAAVVAGLLCFRAQRSEAAYSAPTPGRPRRSSATGLTTKRRSSSASLPWGHDSSSPPFHHEHLERFTSPTDGGPFQPEARSQEEDVLEEDGTSAAVQRRYKPGRRSTVSGPSTNVDESRRHRPAAHPKTDDEMTMLRRSLRGCHLFTQLDEDELEFVVEAMYRVEFVQGNLITLQGAPMDSDSEQFTVIYEGEVSVIKDGTVLRVLRPGQYFGERHLMFVHANCRLTHRVDTPRCLCFGLKADDYRHIVTRVAVDKSELYEGFLDRVTWLKGLTHREKMQLADSLQAVVYNDGDYLIEYDTVGVWLYLIVEGTVEVFGRRNGEVVRVCDFSVGDCVGELEFLNNHRTVADVRAKGRVKAARLHRDHFELCMGPIVDVLRRSSVADERFAYYRALIDAGAGGQAASQAQPVRVN